MEPASSRPSSAVGALLDKLGPPRGEPAGRPRSLETFSAQKKMFAKMSVDAVLGLDDSVSRDLSMIGIKRVSGGSITDSELLDGCCFKKTFSYAGFEQQPKKFENPKIALLNVELELKNEKENAEVRLENVADFQKVVDAEWQIIYDKLDVIKASGARHSAHRTVLLTTRKGFEPVFTCPLCSVVLAQVQARKDAPLPRRSR